jgi:hypothetical protein
MTNSRLNKSERNLFCYISGKPLEDHEVAFAYYNLEHPDIPIHKKYLTEQLRKEWMYYNKEMIIKTTIRSIPEVSPEVISDYIDRIFRRT